jgi:long-chain acyl-CoA synthetase
VCNERSFSFVDIEELSARLGNALRGLGVERGDRVTLYSQNCWEWVVSYYAIARIGAVINPINVMLTPEEVLYVVRDCGANLVLASQEKGDALLDIKGDSPLQHVVLFGEKKRSGAHCMDELLAGACPKLDDAAVAANEVSTIAYTSGTTGHPKGAVLTHGNVVCNSGLTATMHVRNSADVVVTALPTAHVYGNVIMNGTFMCGMTLVLFPRFDEQQVLRAIEDHRATMFEGVPTMYMYLLKYADLGNRSLRSLTRCTVGGQTMPLSKMQEVEERFGCPLLELWGMTELAGLGTTHPLYGTNRLGSIGVPLPYVECRIADTVEASRTLSRGEVGELMVRGPIVMKEYYRNAKATAETIESDGWLHTGDLARMDADGYIFAVDRKKDMILTGGYNVYPAEIERVIAAHPEVAMVAVGSQADEDKGEVPRAYIVLKNGATPDSDSILAYCRRHLAPYKIPRSVSFVADLPKTSTGKILRRELKTLDN